jgi:hypothetical protein
MSLISTASTWTNDDQPKKRVSTIRKTIRAKPLSLPDENGEHPDVIPLSNSSTSASYFPSENAKLYSSSSMSDIQKEMDDRNARVNSIINQMNTVVAENDGAGMADFRPPPQPELNVFKHDPTMNLSNFIWKGTGDDAVPLPSPTQRPVLLPGQNQNHATNLPVNPMYKSDTSGIYSNYHMSYAPQHAAEPQHRSKPLPMNDTKLMEKINYMIHLLENQEVEKTANITEEFVLYTFLGVFMIFVLDSFVRVGKYTR